VEFCYKFEKNIFFVSISSGTSPVVIVTVMAFDVSPHGLSRNITMRFRVFWQRMSHIKGLHILLELNAEKGILQFKQKSSPLKILSSQKRGGSRGVPFQRF
jgi:hypothetical protein